MSMERLYAAAAAVADPALSAWLAGACRKMAYGVPPAQALDLEGAGARRERDRLLYQAAVHLENGGESHWFLAGAIAERLAHPRRQDLVQDLLKMADAAHPLPRTRRRLYDLLLARTTDTPHDEMSAVPCNDDATRNP